VVGFKKIKFFTLENVGLGARVAGKRDAHDCILDNSGPGTCRRDPLRGFGTQDGLFGLLYALESVASLLLMCDRMDLGATIGEADPSGIETSRSGSSGIPEAQFFQPTLFVRCLSRRDRRATAVSPARLARPANAG
jgi:hypothetical protein